MAPWTVARRSLPLAHPCPLPLLASRSLPLCPFTAAQHTKGEFWCLSNCRAATSSAVEWDIPGCYNSALPNDSTCHLTVFYKSGAAKANVARYCA